MTDDCFIVVLLVFRGWQSILIPKVMCCYPHDLGHNIACNETLEVQFVVWEAKLLL